MLLLLVKNVYCTRTHIRAHYTLTLMCFTERVVAACLQGGKVETDF